MSFPGQRSLKQQMIRMIDLLSDLSHWVKAATTQKMSRDEYPSVIPSTQTTARTRVWCQSTLISDQHVSAAVRRKVDRRMRELHLPKEMSSDGGLESDEDQPVTCKRLPFKSGLDRTGATMAVQNITWPTRWYTFQQESLRFIRSCRCLHSFKDT